MHDGVSLETLGVPTAVVVTGAFVQQAAMQREALGMLDLEPVVITHPLSTLTDEQIETRVAEVLARAPGLWCPA